MVAVTESKLYFYITETKQKKQTFTSYRKQIKQKKTRLTKKTYEMQNIKRNHHTRSKSPKTTPILIFCTYNQSLERKT